MTFLSISLCLMICWASTTSINYAPQQAEATRYSSDSGASRIARLGSS